MGPDRATGAARATSGAPACLSATIPVLMTTATALEGPSFRRLERVWLRRLAARIEPVLWIELLGIASLASAFLFWQSRIRLASWTHDHGPAIATVPLINVLALLVVAGG